MAKKKNGKILLAVMLIACLVLTMGSLIACGEKGDNTEQPGEGGLSVTDNTNADTSAGETSEQDNDYTYDEGLETTITVSCVSGTDGIASQVKNDNGSTTLTFGTIAEDTVYSISGTLNGNVVIDVDETETYKFELELAGLTIQSATEAPIVILSGDKVTLVAKKDTENYIYDNRETVTDEEAYAASVYSKVDLDVQGKGYLWITSKNNKGIHTKDDLKVKNLTLYVNCTDNALKGNDSVTITGTANLTLIATQGDGIKTSNSDISSKGNQKGTITIESGTVNVYAACDGLDAAYNVVISGP